MTHEVNHKLTKFRPVLTLEQITYITALCHASLNNGNVSDVFDSDMSASVKKVLVPMIAKVEVGAINPAYKLSETQIIKNAERSERMRYENDLMSPEEVVEYENKLLGV